MLKKEKVNETLGNHPRKKFVILNGNTSGICMIEECTTAAQDVTFKIWGETIFNWGGIVLLILGRDYVLLEVRHRRDLRRRHGVHDLLIVGSTKQELFSVGKSKTENMTYKNKFAQLVERA